MTGPYGTELVLDLAGCDPDVIGSEDALVHWVHDLVDLIGMEAYGPPRAYLFGAGDLAGWTVVQLITTSSIVAHCAPARGNAAFVNVFSCRPFDTDKAAGFTGERFGARRLRATVLVRDAGAGDGPERIGVIMRRVELQVGEYRCLT